ncbi:MAG: hypothetical protein ABW047_12900 [Nitrospiraceae bacterium]
MARLIVRVKYFVYNATEFGSNDEIIVSRIFYDMSVNGQKRGESYSDLTHRVDTLEPEAIEVTHPAGYTGPFNHAAFTDKLIAYYQGIMSRSLGASSMQRANQRIIMPVEFEVQAADPVAPGARSASSA